MGTVDTWVFDTCLNLEYNRERDVELNGRIMCKAPCIFLYQYIVFVGVKEIHQLGVGTLHDEVKTKGFK